MKNSLLIASCLSLVASLHAVTPDWQQKAQQLMDQPFRVTLESAGKKNQMVLVGLEDGNLLFQVGNQGGEGSQPLSQLGDVWITSDLPKDYTKASTSVGYNYFRPSDLDILRQGTYPMVPYISLPEDKCNFRKSVLNLLEGQIQLGDLDEAVFLLDQLDFDLLGPDFEEMGIQLSGVLWEEGERELSSQVMQSIPLERINSSNLNSVLDVTEVLRKEANYKEAIAIYSRLTANESIEDLEPLYWQYYCELQAGIYDNVLDFPVTAKQLEPEDRLYGLQQLVLGLYFIRTQQPDEAMAAVSEGIAYATPMDAWAPELMYRSAQLYETLELSAIAISVYNEIVLFFPSTSWAELAQEQVN